MVSNSEHTSPETGEGQEIQSHPIDPTLNPDSAAQQTITQFQVWQGQFPPPAAVREYEDVCPGAFDRLITMAENQQRLAAEAGQDARDKQGHDIRRGQVLGASVTLASIFGALFCAYIQQPWVATALVAVPVMSVAKAFLDRK